MSNYKIERKVFMLSKNEAVEMAKRLIVDSIWKSARLEGYSTTFPKTDAILSNAKSQSVQQMRFYLL